MQPGGPAMTTMHPLPLPPRAPRRSRTPVTSTSSSSAPGFPASAPRTTCGSSSPAGPSSSWTRRTTGAEPGGPTGTRACAPTATCSPTATGSSRGAARRSRRARRSSPTSTRSSPRTASAGISATGTGSRRLAGPPRTAVDRGGHPDDTGQRAAVHRELPVDVPGLLQPRPSPTSPSGKAWTASRAWSCTPSGGPRTSSWRASVSW